MKRSLIIAVLLALAAAAWIGSGQIGASNQTKVGEKPPADLSAAEAAPAVRVRVSQAEARTSHIALRGRTEADRKVNIKAETQGRIVELNVVKGQGVSQDETLAQIDPDERPARLAEARSLREQRRIEHEAATRLSKKGFRAETQVAASQAALDAAEAAVKVALMALRETTIKAPFDGLVVDRYVEIGDFVESGDPIARIIDLDPLLVVAQVSERDAGRVSEGALAKAHLITGQQVEGVISYISAEADPETRTFRVELEVPNEDARLADGVSAEVSLPLQQTAAHHVSPAILTLSDSGGIGVKLLGPENEVVFAEVEIIDEEPGGIWVTGLPKQAVLITVGQEFVTAGQRVQPIDETTLTPFKRPGGGAFTAGVEDGDPS